MQFILDNLAAVTASQQQAEVRAARTDRQIKGLQTMMLTGMKLVVKLQKGQRELQKGQQELQVGHREIQKGFRQLQKSQLELRSEMKELAAAQKQTDKKFDRWLDSLKGGSNGQNGHRKR
jgi:uncharacterized phage infection (PIP) family protein YhgE